MPSRLINAESPIAEFDTATLDKRSCVFISYAAVLGLKNGEISTASVTIAFAMVFHPQLDTLAIDSASLKKARPVQRVGDALFRK